MINMVGCQQDISIDEVITYSLKTNAFSAPLILTNHSSHIYAFKIKSNQPQMLSLQITNGIIQPKSVKNIGIKLNDKPSQSKPLKLQLNYVVPIDEEIQNGDWNKIFNGNNNIFKKVTTVNRDEGVQYAIKNQFVRNNFKEKNQKQQKKQSPKVESVPKLQENNFLLGIFAGFALGVLCKQLFKNQ